MESAIRHQYDAALALKAPGSAAVTANGNTAAVDLYHITKGRGDVDGRYGIGSFDVVVMISEIDTASGNETYTLTFETVDAAGANPVAQEVVTVTAGMVGAPLAFAFHPATLKAKDADAAAIRVAVAAAGTTPSIKFYAFAAPHSHY